MQVLAVMALHPHAMEDGEQWIDYSERHSALRRRVFVPWVEVGLLLMHRLTEFKIPETGYEFQSTDTLLELEIDDRFAGKGLTLQLLIEHYIVTSLLSELLSDASKSAARDYAQEATQSKQQLKTWGVRPAMLRGYW